jgi:hypothetical protein
MSSHFRMSDAAGRSAVTQAFGFEFGTVAILASLASAMLIPGFRRMRREIIASEDRARCGMGEIRGRGPGRRSTRLCVENVVTSTNFIPLRMNQRDRWNLLFRDLHPESGGKIR